MTTLSLYPGAALAEIAGCYAFWAWLRLGKSFFWLIPGMLVLADVGQTEFNAQIDALVTAGVRVTTCIGIAQHIGSEAVFRDCNIALESAATAFPRFATEGASVISF